VRRRIQGQRTGSAGEAPGTPAPQWSLGVHVTFLTGLPEEGNFETGEPEPLATRTKLAVRGPKRTRRKLVSGKNSHANRQPYMCFLMDQVGCDHGKTGPQCFWRNLLRLDFQILV